MTNIAENGICTRTLLHRGSGEGVGALGSVYLVSRSLLLGKQGTGGQATSGVEKIGAVIH